MAENKNALAVSNDSMKFTSSVEKSNPENIF